MSTGLQLHRAPIGSSFRLSAQGGMRATRKSMAWSGGASRGLILVALALALAGCSKSHLDGAGDTSAAGAGTMAMSPADGTSAASATPGATPGGADQPGAAGAGHRPARPAPPARPRRAQAAGPPSSHSTSPPRIGSGKYSPRNGGVAWVADAQGRWVHTLELWITAGESVALEDYTMAGGPLYAYAGQPAIAVLGTVQAPPDVITSATRSTPGSHTGETWNLEDANGVEVADGNYEVVIEVAEQIPAYVYRYPFAKSGQPIQLTFPDVQGLKDVKLSLR